MGNVAKFKIGDNVITSHEFNNMPYWDHLKGSVMTVKKIERYGGYYHYNVNENTIRWIEYHLESIKRIEFIEEGEFILD